MEVALLIICSLTFILVLLTFLMAAGIYSEVQKPTAMPGVAGLKYRFFSADGRHQGETLDDVVRQMMEEEGMFPPLPNDNKSIREIRDLFEQYKEDDEDDDRDAGGEHH